MWFVTYFEDIFTADMPKSVECGLQVVECLPHVTLSSEDDGLEAVICVGHLNQQTDQGLGNQLIPSFCTGIDG